jgi:hypothetical protein
MTTKAKTNQELLPELMAKLAQKRTDKGDVDAAYRDKMKRIREEPDPETGVSIADMQARLKKEIAALDAQVEQAWRFPHQTVMDL